jgi:hypothetical protein
VTLGVPALFIFIAVSLTDLEPRGALRGSVAISVAAAVVILAAVNVTSLLIGGTSGWKVGGTMAGIVLMLLLTFWLSLSRSPRVAVMLPVLPLIVMVVMGASLNGTSYVEWMRGAPAYAESDAEMTRLGLEIRRRTPVETVIAVVWAGAPPYWAKRTSVDLLGKNDRVIARSTPRGAFRPGHNKWDYRYSIENFRPDLILQTWHLTSSDRSYLVAECCTRLRNEMYVNRHSRFVVESELERISPNMRHPEEER